ncbi:hypothetical protein YC2023_040121 [Brassica napus]
MAETLERGERESRLQEKERRVRSFSQRRPALKLKGIRLLDKGVRPLLLKASRSYPLITG